MRLGLLLCDHVGPEFLEISGDYEDMFRRFLVDWPDVELITYDAVGGDLPLDPSDCDVWFASGSRHSVNDDYDWIRQLERFVRKTAEAGTPFVGICFGHQLIAKALGGSVTRARGGWGAGIKKSTASPGAGLGESFNLLYLHQDQLETLPPRTEILGSTDHCSVSVMSVGGTMVGIQGHPEFEPPYVEAVLRSRRGVELPAEIVDAGLASLAQPTDSRLLADWILAFVESARASRAT
jgi:GMP synthase (glutamine-hydrolysing)